MVVKFKIDNENEIPAALKADYEERDGAWYLKLDGVEDTTALKEKNSQLLREKKALQTRVEAIDAEKEEARLEALRAKGDITALEESWKERNTRETKALKDQLEAGAKAVRQQALITAATELAAKVSTSPTLILPYLKSRLKVEQNEDGEPIVRVVDAAGKASALSITDLEKEVLANKEFAPIIRASNATGGGAGSGSNGNGNNGGAGSGDKPKSIFDMTLAEKREFHSRDPQGYRAQAEREQAEL